MCEPTKPFQNKDFPWTRRDTIFALGLWVTGATIVALFIFAVYGLSRAGL
jgi:hypothetical protein